MSGEDSSPANNSNGIEFITISTLGNGQDFGDLLKVRADRTFGGSNQTRAFLAGGVFQDYESQIYTMDKIEIATTGNAVDFGDLKNNSQHGNGTASAVRFVSMGGAAPGSHHTQFLKHNMQILQQVELQLLLVI